MSIRPNGNFQLQPTSPAINVGTNDADGLADVGKDLAGHPRIVDGVVDMGAYESQSAGVTWTGLGDGVNWKDPANWSDNLVPTAHDDVTVGPAFSAVQIQVASGVYPVHSLNSAAAIAVTNASLTLLEPSTIDGALMLQSGGTVDITDASLTINYGDAADPAGAIVGSIKAAYDSGLWDTAGLTSTTAAGNFTFVVGYSDDTVNHVFLMKYALAGDFNLDGTVDTADFVVLADNFNIGGSDFAHGDSNYDGAVNAIDFNALATNYGRTAPAPAATMALPDHVLASTLPSAPSLFADAAIKPAYGDTIMDALIGSPTT